MTDSTPAVGVVLVNFASFAVLLALAASVGALRRIAGRAAPG